MSDQMMPAMRRVVANGGNPSSCHTDQFIGFSVLDNVLRYIFKTKGILEQTDVRKVS
jgi:hypothetical protein